MSKGVFVLGMHRSGTSTTARVVNLLGVSLGSSDDLLSPDPDNPTGFWESRALTDINDAILELLGGNWLGTPARPHSWALDGRLEAIRGTALRTFQSVYTSNQWVWKDPRNCLTLPFWRNLLGGEMVAVVVYRNPLDVWRSLANTDWLSSRNGVSKHLATALWERYVRETITNAQGMGALVARFDRVLVDPTEWASQVHGFLGRSGFSLAHGIPVDSIRSFVRPRPTRSAFIDNELYRDSDFSAEQKALFSLLNDLEGEHSALPRLDPSLSETPWTEPLLAEGRRAERLERQVDRLSRELARREIAAIVPPGTEFILVDDQQWERPFLPERRALPFLERHGEYWGNPEDSATAIAELERLRDAGVSAVVFAEPSFWWLEYYEDFATHLEEHYRRLLVTERAIVFDLQK